MSLPNILNNEGQIASYQTHIIEDYPMLIIADTAYSVHLNTVSDLSACYAWGSALVATQRLNVPKDHKSYKMSMQEVGLHL